LEGYFPFLGDLKGYWNFFPKTKEPRPGKKRGLTPFFGLGAKTSGKFTFFGVKKLLKKGGSRGGFKFLRNPGLPELETRKFLDRIIRIIGGRLFKPGLVWKGKGQTIIFKRKKILSEEYLEPIFFKEGELLSSQWLELGYHLRFGVETKPVWERL